MGSEGVGPSSLGGDAKPIVDDEVPLLYSRKGQGDESYVKVVLTNAARGVMVGILNPHSFLVAIICVASTYLSSPGMFDIKLETFFSAFILGAVYPTINTITFSYERRELSLQRLSMMKSHMFGIFHHLRDYGGNALITEKFRQEGAGMLDHVDLFLQSSTWDRQHHLREIYRGMSNMHYLVFLTVAHETRTQYSSLRGMPQLVSRCNQSVRELVSEFESLRAIRDYRTPVGLRMFSSFVLHTVIVCLGPYFNSWCDELGDEERRWGCPGAYFSACTFAFVVLLLYHTQRELEDPFDGYGMDDVRTNLLSAELGWEMLLPPETRYLEYLNECEDGRGVDWEYKVHMRESGRVDKIRIPLAERKYKSHGGTGWSLDCFGTGGGDGGGGRVHPEQGLEAGGGGGEIQSRGS
mmetsp:Transcript_56410/g.178491  ORF Transcript_56410/g.178491 Transcript_56410/m.178491 type:complete len:409 (+) Transcript_56410:103-1329(+)